MSEWHVEMTDEVTNWLRDLPSDELVVAVEHIRLLAEFGHSLQFPQSRFLKQGLYELRFDMSRRSWRITYGLAGKQRLVMLLTVFHKQRNREAAEIKRARNALDNWRKN